jgi:hypothetical protein
MLLAAAINLSRAEPIFCASTSCGENDIIPYTFFYEHQPDLIKFFLERVGTSLEKHHITSSNLRKDTGKT